MNELSWIMLRQIVENNRTNLLQPKQTKLFINKKWQVTFGFEYIYWK